MNTTFTDITCPACGYVFPSLSETVEAIHRKASEHIEAVTEFHRELGALLRQWPDDEQ